MENSNKIIIGILSVIILSSVVYITSQELGLRMRVDNDKSTFYVYNENHRWVVSGREYNSLFDGTTKMRRRSSEIKTETYTYDDYIKITRYTPYIRGPIVKDTYIFKGNIKDKELFPISHTVQIINGSGYFYRYEVRDLVYDGPTEKLDITSMSFGRNMKIEWQDGYRWAWIYKSGILKVQYDIKSDDEVYNVRLFDPITSINTTYEYWRQDDDTDDVWLKINVSSGVKKTIFVSNETIYSRDTYPENGTRVFKMFEDCNDDDFDHNQWRNNLGSKVIPDDFNNGTCNVSGDNAVITSESTYDFYVYTTEVRVKTTSETNNIQIGGDAIAPNRKIQILNNGGGQLFYYRDDNDLGSKTEARSQATTTIKTWRFTGTATSFSIYADEVLQRTESDANYLPDSFTDAELMVWGYWNVDPTYIDFILVRNKSSQPTVSTACLGNLCEVNLSSGTNYNNFEVELANLGLTGDLIIFENFSNDGPTIDNLFPADNAKSTTDQIFNCTVTDVNGIANVSFYVNDSLITTNTSGLNSVSYNFNLSIGSYSTLNWTIEACDTFGSCSNSTSRTFSFRYNASFSILLDRLNQNRTYEYGTTANITLQTNETRTEYCVNVSISRYGNNYICNETNMTLLLPIEDLEYNTFSDENITKSLNFTNTPETACFQETANISTVCGGLDNGTYAAYGDLGWGGNVNFLYDGNYSTCINAPLNEYLDINYSKFSGLQYFPIWQIRYNTTIDLNLSNITQECWNQDILMLRILKDASNNINLKCYNGSSWDNLFTTFIDSTGNFCEEAIYWNVSSIEKDSINASINVYEYDDLLDDLIFHINATTRLFNLNITHLNTLLFDFLGYIEYNFEIINKTSDGFEEKQIQFSSASIETIAVNYSTAGIMTNTTNCTLQIEGLTANEEAFRQYDGFINADKISLYDNDLTHSFKYDEFDNSATESNWIKSETTSDSSSGKCTGTANDYEQGSSYYSATQSTSCNYGTRDCSDPASYVKTIYASTYMDFDSININLGDYDYIKLAYEYTISTQCNTRSTPICNDASANPVGTTQIALRDSTGGLQYLSQVTEESNCGGYDADSSSSSATNVFIFNRTENQSNYKLYIDGVYNKDITINSNREYGVYMYSYSKSDTKQVGTSSASANNKLNYIELGGIGLNYTADASGEYYNKTANMTTTILNTFTIKNATNVYLTVDEYKPSGTTINYYVSTDDQSTWQSALPDTFTTLNPQNENLSLRIEIDRGTNTDAEIPHVESYLLEALTVFPENVAVDAGGDGTYEWNMTGILNTTNSPQNVTFHCSELEVEIDSYCDKATESICTEVPINIKSDNAGFLNISNINMTPDISTLNFDKRDFASLITENPTTLNITFSADDGQLNIFNITWKYRGNGNFTVSMYNATEGVKDEKLLTIRYIDFNITYPQSIFYWEIIPYSNSQKNIEPLGQTSSIGIFNVSIDNNRDTGIIYNKINETSTCWDMMFNDQYSNRTGTNLTILNLSSQNITAGNNREQYIWMFVNLTGCSPSSYYYFDPEIYWLALCDTCVKTFDWDDA